MNYMNVEKWLNEICGRGKREKPLEKPTQTLLRPPGNPNGVIETRDRDSSAGRQGTNWLRHRAVCTKLILQKYIKVTCHPL